MDFEKILNRDYYVELWIDDAMVSIDIVTDEMLKDIINSMNEDYIPDYCLQDKYIHPEYLVGPPAASSIYMKKIHYYSRGTPFDESHWGPKTYK